MEDESRFYVGFYCGFRSTQPTVAHNLNVDKALLYLCAVGSCSPLHINIVDESVKYRLHWTIRESNLIF